MVTLQNVHQNLLMRKDWLADWVHPDAIAYRASLEMGERLGKDADFILQVLATAEIIRECAEPAGFNSFWAALRDGENLEAEAERAFARAVAPLLLGKAKDRARLRRLLESAEQKISKLDMPKKRQPQLLLSVSIKERLKARKKGCDLPSLEDIMIAFRDAGGTLDTKASKRHLRKMGVAFVPMKSRGKDKQKRGCKRVKVRTPYERMTLDS